MKTLTVILMLCVASLVWGQAVPGLQHVVIVMSENQSGDSLCQAFPADFDCASTGNSKTLGVVPLTHRADPPLANCPHQYANAMQDIDNGLMDGFKCLIVNGQDQSLTQLYASDIPWLSTLANNLIPSMPTMTQDRMFESEHDPSWGAHLFMIAATDANVIGLPSNTIYWGCDAPAGTTVLWKDPVTHVNSKIFPCMYGTFPTVMDLANAAGISLKVYGPPPGANGYQWVAPDYVDHWRNGADWANVLNIDDFAADVAAGKLANVQIVILIPRMGDSGHPKNSMKNNEAWIQRDLEALAARPEWASTAAILEWDDWGGWYDHVAPPKVNGSYIGLRVASMVVSPLLTHPGSVDHTVLDFGSILKFTEDQFGLGCLTSRDCGAVSMVGEFQ